MNKYTNTRLAAIRLVDEERNRQDAKWGEQNHPPQYWTGILGEEFGEYCQTVNETVFDNGIEERKKGGYDNMMKELTHVAAVAIGAMETLMRQKLREELAGGNKTAPANQKCDNPSADTRSLSARQCSGMRSITDIATGRQIGAIKRE